MADVFRFFREVKSELGKVVWPKYGEFVGSTIVVLVLVLFFSVYLGLLDFMLSRAAEYVFDYFGA
jgi:preprotein translocase subunit SecE